jgi:Spy/CpxP family protein refolding chaperone
MKNRTQALAVLIAVFLVGCVLGIAGLRFWERSSQGEGGLLFPWREQDRANRLVGLLQLTPEQNAQLNAILQDTRRQIDASRLETERNMDAIRAQANAKIEAILNDEQKKKFAQYLKEAGSRGDIRGYRGERGDRGDRGDRGNRGDRARRP